MEFTLGTETLVVAIGGTHSTTSTLLLASTILESFPLAYRHQDPTPSTSLSPKLGHLRTSNELGRDTAPPTGHQAALRHQNPTASPGHLATHQWAGTSLGTSLTQQWEGTSPRTP